MDNFALLMYTLTKSSKILAVHFNHFSGFLARWDKRAGTDRE